MRYKVPTKKIVYDEKKLYNYGINRLSVRDYGRQELFDKMSKWQEDISIVNTVLDKLESLGYLSEERRIRNLINLYLPTEGIKKLKLRLYQKKFNMLKWKTQIKITGKGSYVLWNLQLLKEILN